MWAVISVQTYYIIDKYLDPQSEGDKEIDGSKSMIMDLIWPKHDPYTIKLFEYFMKRFWSLYKQFSETYNHYIQVDAKILWPKHGHIMVQTWP